MNLRGKVMSKSAQPAAAKVFTAPAILTRISALSDGGLSLGFHTNELSLEDKTTALSFQNQFGYVLFRSNQFTDADIPETDAPDEDKTPSQRLRAVLFVLWKQKGGKTDWESFYRRNMEDAVARVKKSLD
jgi:hypothetical protein